MLTCSMSSDNAFAFAHLGTEIKLRDAPRACQATGNHLLFGTEIKFQSKFSMAQIKEQRKLHNADDEEKSRQWWGRAAQKIPLVGRFFAHAAVLYWDQLDRCVQFRQSTSTVTNQIASQPLSSTEATVIL